MTKKTEEFFRKMLEYLPSTYSKYRESIEYYGEVFETVIIEDLFMPEIIKLLTEEKDVKLLKSIFDYFEEVSDCNDRTLVNNFSVTVLEILGNDKKVLCIAKRYMGPKTTELQIEADRDLGRL